MRHELFTYDSDALLAERAVPFLEEGLAEDEAVLAVTTPKRQGLLRERLAAAAGRVAFLDRDEFYTRPEAVLAAYDETLRSRVRGSIAGVRVVAELPICENLLEWRKWMAYEAIVNRALAEHPVWIICAYDTTEVPAEVIDLACRTHPVIAEEQDGTHAHEGYAAPEEIVRALAAPPISGPRLTPVPVEPDPRRFRDALAGALAGADVTGERADRMLVAAGEVFCNARRYGGGLRSVGVGRMGDRFICELADHGPGIDDPLAGYVPPTVGGHAGAGLWVARQLTWRLELVPTADGLVVRLWV